MPAPSLLIGIPSQAEVEKGSGTGEWLSLQSEHLLLGVSKHCLTHSAWSSSGSCCLLLGLLPKAAARSLLWGAPSEEDGSAAFLLLCGTVLHTALLLGRITVPKKNRERKKAESWWAVSASSPQEDVGQLWRRLLQVGLEDPCARPPGPTAASPDAAMSQAWLLARFSILAAWAGLAEATGLGDPALSTGWECRVSHREEGVCAGGAPPAASSMGCSGAGRYSCVPAVFLELAATVGCA